MPHFRYQIDVPSAGRSIRDTPNSSLLASVRVNVLQGNGEVPLGGMMTDLLSLDEVSAQGPIVAASAGLRTPCEVGVVICDDHAMFVGGLADALSSDGIDVLAATHDPGRVTSLVRELEPRVCLLGAHYSGVERLDVLVEVNRASPATIVVLMSATADSHLWKVWDSGEVDVIVGKKCRFAEIRAAIDRANGGERFTIGIERPEPQGVFGPGWPVTARELQVLHLMVAGATTSEMSGSLSISVNTVRTHVQSLLDKLGVSTRVHAARVAVECGLVLVEHREGGG